MPGPARRRAIPGSGAPAQRHERARQEDRPDGPARAQSRGAAGQPDRPVEARARRHADGDARAAVRRSTACATSVSASSAATPGAATESAAAPTPPRAPRERRSRDEVARVARVAGERRNGDEHDVGDREQPRAPAPAAGASASEAAATQAAMPTPVAASARTCNAGCSARPALARARGPLSRVSPALIAPAPPDVGPNQATTIITAPPATSARDPSRHVHAPYRAGTARSPGAGAPPPRAGRTRGARGARCATIARARTPQPSLGVAQRGVVRPPRAQRRHADRADRRRAAAEHASQAPGAPERHEGAGSCEDHPQRGREVARPAPAAS